MSVSTAFPQQRANSMRTLPLFILIILTSTTSALQIFTLDNQWTVFNQDKSISIEHLRIPNGVYSILEEAGTTKSIHDGENDIQLRWIVKQNWTFQLSFATPHEFNDATNSILILHGIDTMATITLNGHQLGTTDNMFVRYRYPVHTHLQSCDSDTDNVLTIEIKDPILTAKELAATHHYTPPECPPVALNGECHMNFLRKMQASFAWDWGLAAPSIGIWKPIELVLFNACSIQDVTIGLTLEPNVWHVDVNVFIQSGYNELHPLEGELTIRMPALPNVIYQNRISINADGTEQLVAIAKAFTIPSSEIDLWWPNGWGNQTLYDLVVAFTPSASRASNHILDQFKIEKSIRIGFRTIELIVDPVANGNLFHFNVNNHAMFMKGTNWIPTDILPERAAHAERIQHLMTAVRDSHMNMIRIWGGGIYESDFVYQLADEYGILIWQDLMFACAMYPTHDQFINSVQIEVEQNVRRLQHHPSIAIWAGNNENELALVQNWYSTNVNADYFYETYEQLYGQIFQVVANNDHWRPFLSSSPSNGNVNAVVINPQPGNHQRGDIHYYDYVSDPWDWNVFPKSRFVSEYGVQSYPTLATWAPILTYTGAEWQQVIAHRQHAPIARVMMDNNTAQKFPPIDHLTDNERVAATCYFTQIIQGEAIKRQTEYYRYLRSIDSVQTMGALYWQLNDVWVAPSWSSIDYSGRFKILHYLTKKFFAPTAVLVIRNPMNQLVVSIAHDNLVTRNYSLTMNLYHLNSLQPIKTDTFTGSLRPNAVTHVMTKHIAQLFDESRPVTEQLLFWTLRDENNTQNTISTNYYFHESLRNAAGLNEPCTVRITDSKCANNQEMVQLQINSTAVVIYFYLEIINEAVQRYTLSDNGFMIVEPITRLTLTYPNPKCATIAPLQADDFKIYTVNKYM